MQRKTKLVYILREYHPQSPEHLSHKHEFLQELARHAYLFLILERGKTKPDYLPASQVYLQRCSFPPLRALELTILLLWLRSSGYRIFYTHYSLYGGILAGLICRLTKGTAYYWNCGRMRDHCPSPRASPRYLWHQIRNHMPLLGAIRLSHGLTTATPGMASYYNENYGKKLRAIRILPNSLNLDRFLNLPTQQTCREFLSLPADVPVLLFLHRLVVRKGAHHIVPLITGLLEKYPTLIALIAGEGPYEKLLRNEIQASGRSHHFRLLGAVANRRVPVLFRAADIYLMPSVEEGFPHTLLEAMASGCPFVAMDVGGIAEYLTYSQKECLAPKGDLRQFLNQTLSILSDKKRRELCRSEGLKNIEKFTHQKIVQTFLTLVYA